MPKGKTSIDDLTLMEMKLEIAYELGLADKIRQLGWAGLSAKETGRLGGLITQRIKKLKQEEVQLKLTK